MSFQHFPEELRELKQWVVWKLEVRDGKQTKVPYMPQGGHAKSTDPATWSSFDDCVQAVDRFNGIGFVFYQGYAGIDLDKCILPDGSLEPWARSILEEFPSYTERSPSKTGLHIIVKSDVPLRGRKADHIECYTHGRFFTVTGDVFENRYELRDLDIQDWYKNTFSEQKTIQVQPLQTPLPSDEKIKNVMFRSANGKKLRDLYTHGNYEQHNFTSQSQADLSLCGALMFYCGNQKETVDRIFRTSALMRSKWDEPRGEQSYGELTLQKSVQENTFTWKPEPVYLESGGKDPKPLLVTENICRVMEFDDVITSRFRLNEFSHMVEAIHEDEWLNLQDKDILDIQRYIATNYQAFARVSKEMIVDAIKLTASKNTVNPPRDYLLGLTWDHAPRIDTWLQRVYGVPDEPVYRAMGSNWLKGLVKRVLSPGCQFDEVLVLEGPQGYRKSTSLRVLGSPWHVESTLSTDDKDFYMLLARNIIVEFSEGDIIGRTSARKLKAIITKTEDSFRPPYEHGIITFKRGCVFAMTTNDSDYQKDDTGGRRWLPVVLEHEADIDYLEENRDQLYAEAVHRVRVLHESTHEYPLEPLRALQQEKQETDEYEDLVHMWYYTKLDNARRAEGVTILDLFKEEIDPREGAILSKEMGWRLGAIFRRMGFVPRTVRSGTSTHRRWGPPEPRPLL